MLHLRFTDTTEKDGLKLKTVMLPITSAFEHAWTLHISSVKGLRIRPAICYHMYFIFVMVYDEVSSM